jgi:hypothetical protein
MVLRAVPIRRQFVEMLLAPFLDKGAGPLWELAANQHSVINTKLGFVSAIPRVEMWWRVIIIIHGYNDAKKSTEHGHDISRSPATCSRQA